MSVKIYPEIGSRNLPAYELSSGNPNSLELRLGFCIYYRSFGGPSMRPASRAFLSRVNSFARIPLISPFTNNNFLEKMS